MWRSFHYSLATIAMLLMMQSFKTHEADVPSFTAAGGPVAETEEFGKKADEAAIWIDRSDPSRSLVIANDKAEEGGLFLFDLNGRQVFRTGVLAKPVGVSVRYDFKLDNGAKIDIVACGLRLANQIKIFQIDPVTRTLIDITTPEGISSDFPSDTYGICLYHPDNKALYAFVSRKQTDNIHQIRLSDDGTGKLKGELFQTFGAKDQRSFVEGLVADDEQNVLYAADEQYGIFKYKIDQIDSESSSSSSSSDESSSSGDESSSRDKSRDSSSDSQNTKVKLLKTFALKDGIGKDREGLALYETGKKGGYLVMSNQGNSTFNIYKRSKSNAFVRSVEASGVTETDGIAVTSFKIPPNYPNGMFVAHNDGKNNLVFYDWKQFSGL